MTATLKLLQDGNSKLGKNIKSWSLPAIKTCPGASDTCKALCYAEQGYYNFTSTRNALAEREEIARDARASRFIQRIQSELNGKNVHTVRVHASGDFYSAAYARAWVRIAESKPDIQFYGYTRSWRVPSILPVLKEFALLPNVRLWFSCDHETGMPPRTKGVRRAYMAVDDQDVPAFKVDMVFRVKRKTVMKYDPTGAIVCPAENGVTEMTCDRCQLCFAAAALPRKDAA